MKTIETGRLYLRPLATSDAENLFNLNLDPEVLVFSGDVPFESVCQARQFISDYDQYRKYGVGRMAVIEKSTDTFVGWCGLRFDAQTKEYDIGFRFFKNKWNQGFATESARACLEHGFTELQLPSIIGRVMQDNIASVSVLKKIGLRFLKTFDFEGREGLIYRIDKQDYQVFIG